MTESLYSHGTVTEEVLLLLLLTLDTILQLFSYYKCVTLGGEEEPPLDCIIISAVDMKCAWSER